MRLITHNERFHYDEVLATVILLMIYPDCEVIRTRDPTMFTPDDIIYDVGSIYDQTKNRFDHHQESFTETYSSKYDYKLSSSGLIYKHFNEQFFKCYDISHTHPLYNEFRDKIYEDFFLGADCVDNGVTIYGSVKPRTIYDMVDIYNNFDDLKADKQKDQFNLAVEFVRRDLDTYIRHQINTWWNIYKDLELLISKLEDYVLVADKMYQSDLILDVEKKYNKDILFLIYPFNEKYKIRAMDKDKGTFESKMKLKEEWRGKTQDELNLICPGAVFVHKNGFVGMHNTLDGAIKMCRDTFNSNQ